MESFSKTEGILTNLEKEIKINENDLEFLRTLHGRLEKNLEEICSLIYIHICTKKYTKYLSDKKIEHKKVQNIFKNFNFKYFSFKNNDRWQNFEVVLNNNETELLINHTRNEYLFRAFPEGGCEYRSDIHININYGEYSLDINEYYSDNKLNELCEKLQLNEEEAKEFVCIFREFVSCKWYK
jgi:hypothetical protein